MNVIRNLTAMAALAVALTIGSQARATVLSTVSFYLTQPEGGGTPISTADAVEVIVDLTATGAGTSVATVEYIAATAGSHMGTMQGPYELNIDGTFTASGCPGSCVTSSGAAGEDAFGDMSLTTGSQTESSFTETLDSTGATDWATAAAVLIPTCPGSAANSSTCSDNPSGNGYSTSDYSYGFEAEVSYGTGTQYAGSIPTPEPASLALLGTGLLGLAALRRRKRKAA